MNRENIGIKNLTRMIITLMAAVFLSGCSLVSGMSGNGGTGQSTSNDQRATKEIFAMDTVMSVTCYGDGAQQAVDDADKLIHELDELLSTGLADSEISKVNAAGGGVLDERTKVMVETALDVYKTTGGAFDITIYPLVKLWGFPERQLHVPSDEELSSTLALVGSDKVSYDADSGEIRLSEGQGIDLGGIAKGYTGDALVEMFRQQDIESAIVSLGGNVQALGTKPDGSAWRCGIVDPHDPENTENLMGVIEVENKAVITSGAYERYYTDGATGKIYHHILDPHTGYPAESGIISATVVSSQGTLADAMSTACYVMGLDKSLEYWREYGQNSFELILMTDDDVVHVTQGLEAAFTSTKYTVKVEK